MYLEHDKSPCIYVPFDRDVVVATPKCAQTYIRETAGPYAAVNYSGVPLYDRRVVFVRDPLERLESAYHYFTNRDCFPQAWCPKRQGLTRISPQSIEEFINLVLAGYSDKHWAPQSEMWHVDDAVAHPFEDLFAVMQRYGAPNYKINASGVPKEGIRYRNPELEALYEQDLEIREWLRREQPSFQPTKGLTLYRP